MFTASAEIYDAIYSTIKDYAAESDQLTRLLRNEHPKSQSVLDVGCGTGEHARLLSTRGYHVDGLDLDQNLLRVAIAKNPAGQFYQGDMCTFRIDRSYDVVLCLGSSIGYAKTLNRVVDALRCFRRHLADGGIIVVEPWFPPEAMQDGYSNSRTVERPPLRIIRTSRTEITERVSRLTFDYEVSGPGGTSHASELHELGLFTRDEMLGAFTTAGLTVSYDQEGLTGRGLYVARAAA